MSLRDFRCQVSGVSLLHAEVAVVLTARMPGGEYGPVALPLFGRYAGQGFVEEVQDGPNADLILAAFQHGLQSGAVVANWESLGMAPLEVDHIETLLSLVSCAQIHGEGALAWEGLELGFSLIQAHVAAALMEAEAEDLPPSQTLESLPGFVLGNSSVSKQIYAPLRDAGVRLRCRFGLSFVALQVLKEAMAERDRGFDSPGMGIDEDDSQPDVWLAEALLAAEGDEELALALAEYGSSDDEAPV